MNGYQLLEDCKNHFLLQSPNGAKVKIAKNGLSQSTSQKIQGMSKGGKVEIEYGASSDNTLDSHSVETFKKAFQGEKDIEKPKEDPKKVAQIAHYADGTPEGGVPEPEAQKPVDININVGQPQQPEREPASGGWGSFPNMIGKAVDAISQNPLGKALLTGDTSHLMSPAQAAPQPGVMPVNQEVPQAIPAVEQPQASPRNALAEMPSGQGQAPDLFQQIKAVSNTPTRAEAGAIQDYTNTQKESLAALDAQNENLKKLEQGYAEGSEFAKNIEAHQQRENELNTKIQDVYNKMITNEEKPKKMFSGGNFLQNIGTALSVLAGGVSQGLTGAKTNPVMDYIDKQIDLDLQRQRHEYGKLQNQYTLLRQQGASEREAINTAKAQQYSTIAAMLHINAQKTQNIQTRAALKQAGAALTLQAQGAAKQAATESTIRQHLSGTAEGMTQKTGMMHISDTSPGYSSNPKNIESNFKDIAKSVPYLVKNEKERPEVIKEVQRVKDTHKVANTLLSLFDKAVETRRDFSNLYNERASVSGLRQNLIPFLKEKEGTPREFEAHAAEKLFPNSRDTESQIQQKRESFINFMRNGSTSSLLDEHEIPYPQLKLGGKKL